ncbi:hypothetical protein VNI00_007329 [Paramarasmius palmivorus]|uniref:Uncharacterized protein n=1 Tax=Paramarasmius palmivorus TaxID=297713 RepID=A0AAW0D0H0_9AGAR
MTAVGDGEVRGLCDSDVEDSAGIPTVTGNQVVGITVKNPAQVPKASGQKWSTVQSSDAPATPAVPTQAQTTATVPPHALATSKPNASIQKSDLPKFTHTLRCRIFTEPNLFNVKRTKVLVPTIQDLVDRLYPEISYSGWIMRPYLKCIAGTSFDVVKMYLKDTYIDKVEEQTQYCTWALRNDGPALYSSPTPSSCTAKPGTPGYQYPDGMFESFFIVQAMRKCSTSIQSSKVDFGHPIGAVSAVAAAVERAFRHFQHNGIDTLCGDQF